MRCKQIGLGSLLVALHACSVPSVDAQTFDLGFRGPEHLRTIPALPVEFTLVGTLTPGGDHGGDGAQGWSLSIAADNVIIVGGTVQGTAAADSSDGPPGLVNAGFVVLETTPNARPGSGCEGREGLVSAVVLSFVHAITLPVDAPSDIVRLEMLSVSPAGGPGAEPAEFTALVEYVDGCQGSGQPVDNLITHRGTTILPVLHDHSVTIDPSDKGFCPERGQVGLALQEVGSHVESEEAAVVAEFPGGAQDLRINVPTRSGQAGEATVYAGISSNDLASGVQGWGLSASVNGGVLLDATCRGTVAADAADDPPGLRFGGFYTTQIVDPAGQPDSGPLEGTGPQGQGVVSSVILSFVMPITLAPTGTATVLAITVGSDGPVDGDTQVCRIEWRDGLQAGQPVLNATFVAGELVLFCGCQAAEIHFEAPPPAAPFVRCDANQDGSVDIADAVWIVNELFRDGPASSCRASTDCNGDGNTDLSDALFNVAYRFQDGPPPPPPFPDCDFGPAGDDSDCSSGCAG